MKTWANVEKTLLDMGISYSRRDWLFLCDIEGRQFYYSPQTGKWRVKGKRAWHKSENVNDFITQAKEYSPPENKSNQTKNRQQKTQRKSSKENKSNQSEYRHQKTQRKSSQENKSNQTKNRQQKTQKKSSKKKRKKSKKTKHSTYTSSDSDQKRRTGKVDEIRDEFLEAFGQYLQQQRERNYKIGWIWYSLLDRFLPTPTEICWLCVVFEYSPWWAFYKIKDFYFQVNREQIFAVIDLNRDKWLNYFQSRWGIKEDSQYKREQRPTNQSAGYAFTHQTYLELLRLSFPFTKQELKSAYRRKALETHPDSGGTSEAFREVHAAYQILLCYIP